MNKFSFLKYSVAVVSSLMFLTSCDKDYNTVGADIIGDDNYLLDSATYPVTTYNQFDGVVQSNNLPINQLGVIDNGVYGITTSSFVTQLQLAVLDPIFSASTVVDKVELTVPYFSTQTNDDGTTKTYKLDSIYGSGKINLKIYESNKFLKNIDPATLLTQRYYSDEFSVFNSSIVGTILNNSATTSENSEFQFSAAQQEELTIASGVETTTKVAPRMKLQLDKTYFENMLKTGKVQGKLASNTLFQEYFRGLFFKVENFGTEKSMALLNFASGKITVYYKETPTDVRKTLVLNMASNTVNLFQNQFSNPLLPTNNMPAIASSNLYLKGGSGYHSYIDLFGIADALGVIPKEAIAPLKSNNWLINEANLVFTVDKRTTLGATPKRIYLYNVKSRKPIIDYYTDGTGSSTQPKYAKSIYGGIVSESTTNGTTKYKIKITNHLRNIIQNDSLNVRLGLSVTEDISKITNLFNHKQTPDEATKPIPYYHLTPLSSVINPLGTILYGSDASIDASKRVKLEIFYTKPN